MFPPINRKWAPEFTDFNYWKPPMQEFVLPDLTPPSPALSARSDASTSNQSALARLRNFSLVGSRQPLQNVNLKQMTLPPPATASVLDGALPINNNNAGDGPGLRSSHLRQMSSFERLGSRLVALTQSPSSTVDESGSGSGSGSYPSRSSGSSTYLDSDEEGDVEDGELKRRRRPRSTSMTSMPGSLDDDMHFGMDDEEEEEGLGDEEEGRVYEDENENENEEEAAEEAFDEDFYATGEMKNVPFL
ncbi:hypothetical protein PAXINDRAFT_19753 [Paxillus involutus ATCC 200175]|uniref:Uncharacterized protein n=1 Tax=Paxillus involutus ATCC 200175 TaxID=664439 RepID=A0A0C9SW99_PAXIN|nr:hypothetical protein PAXINDRAFT_19753 [Paxillus involutus ATCC 200175]